MFKKIGKIPNSVWILIKTLLVSGIVLAVCGPLSCKATEEGIILVDDSYSCPKIEDFFVTGENSARIVFDQKIDFKGFSLNPAVSVENVKVECSEAEKSLCLVDVIFSENLRIGEKYNFYGEVYDNIGNSLTFSLPLLGFNGRTPDVEITEIHPKYSSGTNSAGKYFKCEYVELRVLSDGNLSGMELYSASDGAAKNFVFPAVEVSRGEIVIVHLRKKEDSAVNELGGDLALSKTKYSSDNARDLWAENESARLGDEMDVVLLRKSVGGDIADSVCYAPEDAAEWKTEEMKNAARMAFEAGKWDNPEIAGAVKIAKMTASKSIERIADESFAASWRVSATSGETPGKVAY